MHPDMIGPVEIIPPAGDGTWWIAVCRHHNRILGRAQDSRHNAVARAFRHVDTHHSGRLGLRTRRAA